MEFDKRQAVAKEWRISEAQLLTVAAAGGSIGIGTGMLVKWHKVRKPRFLILIPLFILINLSALRYLMREE
ncbi:Uncharacterized membrane protein YsdA, DUF1294 family [Cyclonatronum proteinivorum]|uniref:Uncharacterized membrane protein YsdA, DUF1294 family n=2 Tax=Cyclonatronum proteinivorum TaxID=1457365 RepID=A0A345UJR1_9BACT|nr:Uncharacterized membrane protein YsdA, DUF1294 family [Cyclonatronum proteinivorum]